MALSKTRGSKIVGIVSIVPKNTEDNLQLDLLSETDREAILLHTGIRFRRKANYKQNVKELYKKGIERLLEQLNWDTNSIDILICVTQTPHITIPSIACQIHGDMAFPLNTLSYDINLGCSGFVYGLHTVNTLITSLEKKNAKAILCCGDVSSQLIDAEDRSVKPIFSDAVSVIGIEMMDDKTAISGYFNLQTEGSGQKAIFTEKMEDQNQYMRLNGIDVFNYSLKLVPNNVLDLLKFSEKDVEFPDLYVFHQANKVINDAIIRKLKLNTEKVPSSLYKFGNTASASIPITLGLTWNKTIVNSGWILLSGFGVGFSLASSLIPFEPRFCSFPEEM